MTLHDEKHTHLIAHIESAIAIDGMRGERKHVDTRHDFIAVEEMGDAGAMRAGHQSERLRRPADMVVSSFCRPRGNPSACDLVGRSAHGVEADLHGLNADLAQDAPWCLRLPYGLKIHAMGSCEEHEMSASHAFLPRAFPNGNKGQLHARGMQKRQLVVFCLLLAIGIAVVLAPRSFSRIGIEQERGQFEAMAGMLAREKKVRHETLGGLAALLKATASDCDAAVVCKGSLKEKYLHARAMLDDEIRKQIISGP